MTDKELDALIKDALSSDKMPDNLNQKLLARAQKKVGRNKKIIYITKWASSVAAVFICGIAVLSYFNSNTSKTIIDTQTENKPSVSEAVKKETPPIKKEKEEAEVIENHTPAAAFSASQTSEKDALSKEVYDPSSDIAVEESEEIAEHAPLEAALTEKALPEEASIEKTLPEEAMTDEIPVTINSRSIGDMKAPLFSLFAENYDFKSIIYSDIANQLQQSGKDASILGEISGYEEYRIEYDGSLFILFPEGSIAPA